MIYCPKCRAAVVKKSQDGKVRIRTRIVAFDGQQAEGVCTRCGADLVLPLELDEGMRKAIFARRRLVVAAKKVDTSKLVQ